MIDYLQFLHDNTTILLIMASVLGLSMGSFITVVIYRYPLLLKANWQIECQHFLNLPITTETPSFNLAVPLSQCPLCQQHIPLKYNIPLVSYIFLGRKCHSCKQKISWHYPTIELISCLLTIVLMMHYRQPIKMLSALFLTYSLIVLAFIDFKHQILPDQITLTTLWIGLALNLWSTFTTPSNAIIGVLLGYLTLWTATWLMKLIRGKQGMGHGDFKMMAMIGAWLGPYIVINTLLLSVLFGIALWLIYYLKNRIANRPFPFGPAIAAAGWISMTKGPFLLQYIVN